MFDRFIHGIPGKTASQANIRVSKQRSKAIRVLNAVFLVPFIATASAFGQFTVAPTTADVFDVAQGTTITAFTPGLFAPEAVFGANARGAEPDTAFCPDVGQGNSSFIELQTADRIALNGIRLYGKNDGGTVFRRAMSAFRLLADVDADGTFETVVIDKDILVNYSQQPDNLAATGNALELNIAFQTIVAQNWRVEFEQGTSASSFEGVRIIEVDGITPVAGSILQPANVTSTYRQGISGSNIGRVSYTFDQSGLSQPYVSGVTDFDDYLATTIHANSNTAMMLVNSNGRNQPNGVVELGGTITLDLGAILPIDALGLWAAGNSENISAMAVYTDTDANFANGGTVLIGEFNVARTLAGRTHAFSTVETRFIHIVVIGHSGTDFIRHGEFAVRIAPAAVRGDMNCDGIVNGLDIDGFTLALTDPAGYENAFSTCNLLNGDFTGDDATDFADLQAFIDLVVNE